MTKTEKDPLDVSIEDIELPPEHLDEELDNAGLAQEVAEPARADPVAPKEVAELEFLSDPQTRQTVHVLLHPFRWNGEEVTEITIRRLTVSEVGQALSSATGSPDFYDIYAAMTGYPAPVLRGLMDDDGNAVTGLCQDFFPHMLRREKNSPPSQETGGQ